MSEEDKKKQEKPQKREKYKLCVFVSGSGTNLQTIIDAIDNDVITSLKICEVISSNPKAYALQRAEAAGIDSNVMRREDFETNEQYAAALSEELKRKKTDLIFLAGYLKKIPARICREYEGRIANIHPSLIPKHAGPGMYGLAPHKSVLEAGEKVTGVTVHYVNEKYDDGDIIARIEVPVHEGDSPEELQARVMREGERKILPRALQIMIENLRKSEETEDEKEC